MLSGFCPARFGDCSAVWCSAADTHLKLLDRVVRGASFRTGAVFECGILTLLFVDLWKYCVCCIKSGLTRCSLFMVLCLDRMCQCGLHAVLWLHIGILMQNLAISQYLYPLSLSQLNDLANPVFDGVGLVGFKSRTNIFSLA